MKKSNYIKAITDLAITHPDYNIDGTLVFDLYEHKNGTLRHNGILYTLVEIKPNGEHNLVGFRENNGKKVYNNLCKLPLSVLEIVWENMKERYTPETVDTRKAVKDRTYEIAELMKTRIEPLIERAFMTGAFDCDEAYETAYFMPKAIMVAVFKTIMYDTTSCPEENAIREEADNIAKFL